MPSRDPSEFNAFVKIDEQAALALLDGQRGLLKELAAMYCEDAPEVLNDLRSAVESGDCREARRAIHSLKGLAATFIASPTVELAQRLEDNVASGDLSELVDGGLERLGKSIEALACELRECGLVE